MQFTPHRFMKYSHTHSIFSLSRKAVACLLALGIMAALLTARIAVRPAAAARVAIQSEQPSVGPGIPQVGSNALKSALSNTKAGSVLFLPKYTSDNANPGGVNTIMSLTNTNPRDGATVRIFFVRDCQIASSFLNLAANQTRTLLASTEDPGKTGYMVVTAVNGQGIPTQFNWLIGSASIITGRDANGHEATYNAVGVAKRTSGAITVAEGAGQAAMKFDDTDYDRLPQTIALDQIQNQDHSAGAAVRTDVAIFSPAADL